MSRAKGRRATTKGGRRDLPSAVEVALDDMLTQSNGGLEDDAVEVAAPAASKPALGRTNRPKLPPPVRQLSEAALEVYEPVATRAVSSSPLDEQQIVGEEEVDEVPDTELPDTELPDVPSSVFAEVSEGVAAAEPEGVLASVPVLRVVVHEESVHLGSVQSAIGAAGHTVAAASAGRDGVTRVIEALHGEPIDVVFVALPGGEKIIDAALAIETRRPVVIASVDGRPVDAVQRANALGADLVTVRPHDIGTIAPLLLAAARLTTERRITHAARGAEHVLRARLDELADPEPRALLPFEMFQRVLEIEIRRAKRYEYALSVALFAVDVSPAPPPGIRGILRARAGNALIHAIRDIDIATQVDHERFLVLLPYTDLMGATGLARRAIAAVASGDAVVAVGRSFSPRVVGAVAGGQPAKAVSFARLMKDAARALEQARRDGADLAVQP